MPRTRSLLVAAALAAILPACSRASRDGAVYPPSPESAATAASPARPAPVRADSSRGRLAARPTTSVRPDSIVTGLQPLGLETGRNARDGVIYVPKSYRPGRPTPMIVLLHGEGSTPRAVVSPIRPWADSAGIILVAPQARGRTWDAIGGGTIGADVAFVDRALAEAFARFTIDPARVTVGGFSEGGSYALMLALANGDLFRRAIAFSPGGIPGGLPQVGKPRVFVAHGKGDRVKRIADTRKFVVEELERRGYDVQFLEFQGGHTIPPEVAQTAVDWIFAYGK